MYTAALQSTHSSGFPCNRSKKKLNRLSFLHGWREIQRKYDHKVLCLLTYKAIEWLSAACLVRWTSIVMVKNVVFKLLGSIAKQWLFSNRFLKHFPVLPLVKQTAPHHWLSRCCYAGLVGMCKQIKQSMFWLYHNVYASWGIKPTNSLLIFVSAY